jgi:hypothetical protein
MAEANSSRRPPIVAALLTFIFLVVLFLRHDYWNWDKPGYLLLGFLPVGLWWQALVTILASVMMWLMVTLAWPSHLEQETSSLAGN